MLEHKLLQFIEYMYYGEHFEQYAIITYVAVIFLTAVILTRKILKKEFLELFKSK